MTVDEVYSTIANRMIKGMMLHNELADYYKFLGLDGYSKCHEYHYFKESKCYRKFNKHIISHHNKLIPDERFEYDSIIPASWYAYSRDDVDTATKQGAVKKALIDWVNWESDTKELYERMYKELMNENEVASALYVGKIICEVDKELSKAMKYHLNKKAMNYDLVDIVTEQKSCKKKYCDKIERIHDEYRRD